MAETLQPLGPNQERWLKALESGEWKQAQECLQKNDCYCCLGVGCMLFFPDERTEQVKEEEVEHEDEEEFWTEKVECRYGYWFGEGSLAPRDLVNHLALFDSSGIARGGDHQSGKLTVLNDDGKTFPEIAAIIRRDPSVYFREPR